MRRTYFRNVMASAFLLVMGCANPANDLHSAHDTSFNDHARVGIPAGETRGDRLTPSNATVSETVRPYQIPEKIKAAVQNSFPELVQEQKASAFKVEPVKVTADPKSGTIRLTGTLQIPGREDEYLELACHFDPAVTPWSCADMFPVDAKLAEQKRMQATATCDQLQFDGAAAQYRCKNLGVELYVSINGKTESQLFQTQPFELRYSSAGDTLTAEGQSAKTVARAEDSPDQTQFPKTPSGKFTNRITDEADPSPAVPDVIDDRVKDQDVIAALSDANVAVEATAPLPTPAPVTGKYSIPGIETVKTAVNANVRAQAFGAHTNGFLRDAAELPVAGKGFVRRYADGRNFGTDFTIQTLTRVAGDLDAKFPGRVPVVIANIAQKRGGHMCSAAGNCHASHQTGLDVDVVMPSKQAVHDMWNLCPTQKVARKVTYRSGKTEMVTSTVCVPGAAIYGNLDDERAWDMLQDLVCGPAASRAKVNPSPVIAMFLDHEVKSHLCRYTRTKGENLSDPNSCAFRTLQAIKNETGHFNHVHVRLRCPGNSQCQNSFVSTTNSTGC